MRTRRRKTARARGTFPFNPAGFPFNLPPPSSSRHLSRQKYVNPPFINPYINPRHTKRVGEGMKADGTKDKRAFGICLGGRTKKNLLFLLLLHPPQTFFPSHPLWRIKILLSNAFPTRFSAALHFLPARKRWHSFGTRQHRDNRGDVYCYPIPRTTPLLEVNESWIMGRGEGGEKRRKTEGRV